MLFPLLLSFLAAFALVLGLMPIGLQDDRPKLHLNIDPDFSSVPEKKKKKNPFEFTLGFVRKLTFFNAPLAASPTGQRIARDLSMAKSTLTVEEFILIKEILI